MRDLNLKLEEKLILKDDDIIWIPRYLVDQKGLKLKELFYLGYLCLVKDKQWTDVFYAPQDLCEKQTKTGKKTQQKIMLKLKESWCINYWKEWMPWKNHFTINKEIWKSYLDYKKQIKWS